MATRNPQGSTSGATSADPRSGPLSGRGDKHSVKRRTPAQWYCLLAGAALLLAGIFGFIADATFDLGTTADPEGGNADGQLQGDSFLGFEVNGWHNVVHLVSGLVLLAAANTRTSAKAVALTFGIVYGLVTLVGLIDGNDVFGIIPVNAADNVLHLVLSALGIATALISRPKSSDPQDRRHPESGPATVVGKNRAHN